MPDILTFEEYRAIAVDISLPVNAYINGKFMRPRAGATMESINPATGLVLAEVAACGPEDVDFAVAKSREAFDRGDWSKMHPGKRKETMNRSGQVNEASSP